MRVLVAGGGIGGLTTAIALRHQGIDALVLEQAEVMAEIGAGIQLASNAANQLLQIRGLLIAQQNVIATRNQALADNESKQQAASDKHYAVPAPSNRAVNVGF